MKPKGWVMLDTGAVDALRDGKSLLPVGVKTISGDFERGDAVEIKAPSGEILGVGLIAYSADDARQLLGRRSNEIMEILGFAGRKELVHRNDMALAS